ncbi:hypothetical protein R1sor_009254 [Riccia sorocarpa]|uniref:Uncharacterized protein n=1 Tax=Riccia sorocarpa TaxID=122646 RepID=A0ABD3H8I7_9MARC
MLTRNEVFPFLNLDRLEDEGIVEIDPKLFGPGGGGDILKVNISEDGLRRQLQFRNSDDSDRVVPPLNIENEFLQRHGRATLKDAWRLVAKWFNYTNETFRNEGWYIDDLSYFASIGRPDLDKKCKVVIRHALRWVGRFGHSYARTGLVLLAIAQVHPGMGNSRPDWHAWATGLSATAADVANRGSQCFRGTKVVWDSERGELIAEQERLKSALQEVQQREEALRQEREELQGAALEASLREEALRKEHESLQHEYSRQKDEWEAKNQKLSEEIEVLHEERKRITSKADNVEAQLGRIQSDMEAQNPSEDMDELKRQLLQKEEQLQSLREADAKDLKRLRAAKKKGQTLEKELSKMPGGLMVKAESKTLDILRSGRKWQVTLYPPVFDCSDPLAGWKPPVVPVPCAFCKGIISPGTDLRIPDYGHSYHVSCVCSCFGVNFLVCWKEDCSATIPLSWVKEFNLDREMNLSAVEERMLCSVDMRSLPPSEWDELEDLTIVGVPAMGVQRREFLESMEERLTAKTCDFVMSSKTGPRARLLPPPHRVAGDQFKKWTQLQNGAKCSDWTGLWNYPSSQFWIFSNRVPRHEANNHNRSLATVGLDVPRGKVHLRMLYDLNTALCIRLRPWDGIFLEHFARGLLILPWAMEILRVLVSRQFVSVWRTGLIPMEVLESSDSYKVEGDYHALKWAWSLSKVWKCDDASHSR